MSNPRLHGVIVPTITPLDEHEDVDEAAFRQHLRRLLDAGVHGIFVGGSAGEGPLLTRDQWQRMAEIAHDAVRDSVPLLGGVMDVSARRVCEKVAALRKIGYRRFVLTPTYYIAVRTAEEHLRLFAQAREAAGDMEMIAYNIPQCTGSSLAVDTLCELARRGWIRVCKESSGDLDYFRELVRRSAQVELSVLQGDEKTMADGLRAGACGVVPVCANVFPEVYIRLYEAAVRNEATALAQAYEDNLRVREPLVAGGPCWLSGIKYAASRLGIGSGRVVSPLAPVEPQQAELIDRLLQVG